MRKKKIIVFVMLICVLLSACSPTKKTKQEVPKPLYTKVGYGIKGEVEEDGTVVVTYALLGTQKDKIEYLRLDQIEQKPKSDRHLFTNRELETAYGLSYKTDNGEWNEQVRALEYYISGNGMTIDEVNEIPTYKKDEEHLKVPKEGTDLEAGCSLDISDFLDVINEAYENREKADATYLAIGEDVRVSNKDNQLKITFAFVGTNYRYKICFSDLETYVIDGVPGTEVISQKEKAQSDPNLQEWQRNVDAFNQYIQGLNMVEAYNVETYDPGNGIETALPLPGSDLAEVCNIDLNKIILALKEAANRL